MTYNVKDISDLTSVIEKLIELMKVNRIFLLYGGLGAGKTTLVKEWMKALGVKDQVTSPTFSLINQYKAGESNIFHIDLYRLDSIEEVYNIGLEELLDKVDNYIIIEWPQICARIILETHVVIEITESNLKRLIDMSIHSVKT